MTWMPLAELFQKGNAWWNELPPDVRKAVLARSRRQDYAPGERLHARGDPPDGMYCVEKGCVQASGVSPAGRETILDFYGPGVWFGETPILSGMSRGHDIVACEPSVVLELSCDDVEDLIVAYPAFARGLLRLEARRLVLLLVALETYSAHSMEQRLANRLLLLAVTFGRGQADGRAILLDLRLPQHVLSQLIGTTRQRVNQILLAWERDGIASHDRGRLLIHKPDALSRMIAS